MQYISEKNQAKWGDTDLFEKLSKQEGDVFRSVKNRRTIRFEEGENSYFCKYHRGVGWWEIIKNLLSLRLPIVGARNEWLAIIRLEELGVDTMTIAAYGERGKNPAKRESFIVTDELTDTVSLEDVCADWNINRPLFTEKQLLLQQIAQIGRTLHMNGVCHRDFYLCHFLLHKGSVGNENRIRLSLIDLHRALIKNALPRRWIIKDLAGLYFSAMDCGLTRRDLLRFIRLYSAKPLREALVADGKLWRDVQKRALATYARLGDK